MSTTLFPALLVLTGCQMDTVRIFGVPFISYDVAVGANPANVVPADVNGDGHVDILVANQGDDDITVLLGDGAGTIRQESVIPAGENPATLAVADFDEDGDLDVAVANHETRYLTILLGNGSGSFVAAPNSPRRVDISPHSHVVRAADFDADGHVDLVVDHRDAGGLLILRGKGDATFEAPGVLVDMGGDPYRGMALGDLNHDGQLDVVTPNPREVAVRIATDRTRLAFETAPSVGAPAPFGVELLDFDGDDHLDLIAASNEGSSLVQLFLGDGRSAFREAVGSPIRFAPGAKAVARGDLNGDGISDAVVTSYQSSDVLIMIGGQNEISTARVEGGGHPWGVAVIDLNRDGVDDLVIADNGAASVRVYVSQGGGMPEDRRE